ncbi:hypothetical protein FB451DRAFT_1121349 [Mycena latifolia]|nr:hypothetical protein FB451DRAFT_1121349 [Mycena latifolia]
MPSYPQSFNDGRILVYFTFTLVAQTFFFGGYTVLIILSTRILLKRGLKTETNRVLFILGLFMYILTTAYWAYSIADVANRMQNYLSPVNPGITSRLTKPYDLFNALALLNYALSDGIVVWRAWVICSGDHRKYLYIPVGFLLLTALAIAGTIGLRIADLSKAGFGERSFFAQTLNILQVSNVSTSFLSNLASTILIGVTAWRHRQRIKDAFRNKTKGDQILILLFESGLFYCFSGLTVVVAMLIRLPHGTLGDIYIPVATQFAGAYTPVVLLLVRSQTSLGDTEFLDTISDLTPSRAVSFQPVASRDRNRTVLSTLRSAVHSGPERSRHSSDSGSSAESASGQDGIEENLEKKRGDLEALDISEPGDVV